MKMEIYYVRNDEYKFIMDDIFEMYIVFFDLIEIYLVMVYYYYDILRLLFELIVEFVLNLSVNDINNVNNVNDVNFLVMLEVDFDLMKKVK